MKVSIVIPNWNGKHLLKVCLSSLKKQTFKDMEIVVVDNGSTDGSADYIKRYFAEVKIVPLDKNYGFAKAVNEGIKNSKGKYVVLINNDAEVEKSCLEYLIKAIKSHKKVGFVATKMLNFYNRKIIDSAGDYIDNVGHANNIGMGEKDSEKYNVPGYTFLVTGGGSIFRREVFERVGFFDEDYFAYFEDVDLCLRSQMQGFKGWFEPKAKIYHIHKATSLRFSSFLEYLQFRNMMITIIKDFPNKLIWSNFNWLLILLVNLNTVRFLATKGLLMSALKAEMYVLWNLPKLLNKRFAIQNTKKVSDDYLISNFQKKKITFWGLRK